MSFAWIFRPADAAAIVLCVATLGFLVSGSCAHVKRFRFDVSVLQPLNPREPALSGTGFFLRAHYGVALPLQFDEDVKWYGSWPGTFASVGEAHSAWYAATSEFYLAIAGYPNRPGNSLALEVRTAHSGVVRLPVISHDPAEVWRITRLSLEAVKEPVQFRIVAVDHSTGLQGWLAFTEPFEIRSMKTKQVLKQTGLVLLATAASIVFFLGPGLLLRQKAFEAGRRLSFVWVPAPGLILLALIGACAWFGPRPLSPGLISRVALWAAALYGMYRFVRMPLCRFTSMTERRVLLVVIVLMAIAVAKAEYSVGPAGELFGGYISRTLEVGERSDPTFPYAIVEIAARRLDPNTEFAKALNGGWSFSSRGPVAGLAAMPIVLAGPAKPPTTFPAESWMVFDPEGYSAYRIAMIAMIASSLLVVFGLGEVFLDEQWSFFVFLVAVTAPFVVHEIYFTWPKLVAASFVLLAVYLVFQRRYLFSGLTLGFGCLCHPSALIWILPIAALVFLARSGCDRAGSRRAVVSRWAFRCALVGVGAGFWVLLWRIVNGNHYGQGVFLQYFTMSDAVRPSFAGWLDHRYRSLVMTLAPLDLFFRRDEPGLHSIYGDSSPVIPFFFQYWNTLPFGAGIAFFSCLVRLMYVAWRRARAWLLLIFVIPLFFFAAYFGWPVARGLMREGLHAWFLGLIIFAGVIWREYLAQAQTFWRICNWAVLLRGIEILTMLLIPSIWSTHLIVQRQFVISDVLALAVMLAGTVWLAAFTFRFAETLRLSERMRGEKRLPSLAQRQNAKL